MNAAFLASVTPASIPQYRAVAAHLYEHPEGRTTSQIACALHRSKTHATQLLNHLERFSIVRATQLRNNVFKFWHLRPEDEWQEEPRQRKNKMACEGETNPYAFYQLPKQERRRLEHRPLIG